MTKRRRACLPTGRPVTVVERQRRGAGACPRPPQRRAHRLDPAQPLPQPCRARLAGSQLLRRQILRLDQLLEGEAGPLSHRSVGHRGTPVEGRPPAVGDPAAGLRHTEGVPIMRHVPLCGGPDRGEVRPRDPDIAGRHAGDVPRRHLHSTRVARKTDDSQRRRQPSAVGGGCQSALKAAPAMKQSGAAYGGAASAGPSA